MSDKEKELNVVATLTQVLGQIEATLARLESRTPVVQNPNYRWLTNQEFCAMLDISVRTAQNMRDNRVVSYSQLGNKIYYKLTDVLVLLEANKKPCAK
jgi:hypothetical protein